MKYKLTATYAGSPVPLSKPEVDVGEADPFDVFIFGVARDVTQEVATANPSFFKWQRGFRSNKLSFSEKWSRLRLETVNTSLLETGFRYHMNSIDGKHDLVVEGAYMEQNGRYIVLARPEGSIKLLLPPEVVEMSEPEVHQHLVTVCDKHFPTDGKTNIRYGQRVGPAVLLRVQQDGLQLCLAAIPV